jgi:tRNA nucleotidyltransferase (CCA-adding enzyme)
MKIWLVGGAVRDALLGRPVRERDWVVVGATPEQLLNQGFKPVGKDFPVFLHPDTREEYALARTERKTAPGYHGFEVTADAAVTLEEDLRRRDLTINAMAQDEAGRLIDPFGGQQDLEQRVLRHVSPAFAEDPVRILRLARFAARFAPSGFTVAPETNRLMQQMVGAGEIEALVSERVFQELARALSEPEPAVFFRVLRDCGALARLFPEIDGLFGVPQPERYHPEIDTGLHCLLVLQQAVRLSEEPVVRFAALTHDLGKGLTPPSEWPRHHGHEVAGLPLLEALCERYKMPGAWRTLARNVMRHHGLCHRAFELRPSSVVDLFHNLDAFRKRNDFEAFLTACTADARGRTGLEEIPYPQADYLRTAFAAALAVPVAPLLAQGLKGEALGAALRQQRIQAVKNSRLHCEESR